MVGSTMKSNLRRKIMTIKTKQVNGGWMVFVDGRAYLDMPRTLHVAEMIATNARKDIKNGVSLDFPA